jgi:hypothetical protein
VRYPVTYSNDRTKGFPLCRGRDTAPANAGSALSGDSGNPAGPAVPGTAGHGLQATPVAEAPNALGMHRLSTEAQSDPEDNHP